MTPEDNIELRRLNGAIKATIEELGKQNYASVDAILREVERRLDRLTGRLSGARPA